ncbi:aldo/keto reductase [Niabella drilacis]|uniref:Predicted oxidoreductase n=1 Tax=Niabella drilacis (strain DSM 25811 / CCM 8410 / CCUG 62505 / LMG 26954 / E90) TaxID=1285928 RepID=A0A1G6LV61_NIADE|nr:aldo/keto reductase [Niabella drilacis]SDC47153.1 Predicted oxidoreductase [Niabella drilacis]
MKKRKLGRTGIEVSEMAFGTVALGLPYGLGIEHESQLLPEDKAVQLLQTALGRGIDFFDTARQYGKSEALLGRAFRQRRQEVVIATKCAHLRNKDHTLPAEKELAAAIERSLAESLEALQTGYVDILMLHDGDEEIIRHVGIRKIFEAYKKEGVIRATGVSTYTPQETKAVMDSGGWDVVQVPFNLMDQRQAALFDALDQRGMGIVVRSVLLKGLLSERGQQLHPALKKVEQHIASYAPLSKASGLGLPQLATKFVLAFPQVSAVLVGIDRMEYLQEALDTVAGKVLEPEFFEQARNGAFKDPGFLNLHEWSVQGWLK